jgi:transposase
METPPALLHEVWAQIPPEAQAYIRELEARVETLTCMVHALQEQVGTLQAQLHQTSRNSSRPPSTDPPQPRRPRRPRSKRRRGAQPGHPGHTRPLLPVDEVNEVVVLKPAQCPQCHEPFAGDDPKPWRHQVIEIPPIKPTCAITGGG